MPQKNDVDFGRLEERMVQISDRFAEAAKHQEKMWGRIDEILNKIVKLESVIENSEIKSLHTRVVLLEYWKNSMWRFFSPALSAIAGVVATYVLAKVFHIGV